MKICKNCGTQVPDDKKFCGACGYKFPDPAARQPPQPQPQQSRQQQGYQQSQQQQGYQQSQQQQGYQQSQQQQGYQQNRQQGYQQQGQGFSGAAGAAFNQATNTADHTAEFDPQDIYANKAMGIIACFTILFFVPLVAAPNSRYGKYYANQGLVLLLTSIGISIISGIVGAIFSAIAGFTGLLLFSLLGGLISFVLGVIPFVLFIILLVNACNGKAKDLPFVGAITIIKY